MHLALAIQIELKENEKLEELTVISDELDVVGAMPIQRVEFFGRVQPRLNSEENQTSSSNIQIGESVI